MPPDLTTPATTGRTRRSEASWQPDGDNRIGTWLSSPWLVLAVVGVTALAMGWQFLTDPSRGVPAFDAAWYQWRAEYLLANEPGPLIEVRGADGALAGGYRVAEPALGALMRTVGGLGPDSPTVLLSILFRVLAVLGIAAFAWQRRRDPLLLYLTLAVGPPLFLLQRFFGFLDNFFAVALMAGVVLLLEPMRRSWVARGAVVTFLYLGGLTHPTTLALFLLSLGAVAGYRLVRERSFRAVLDSEGSVIVAGTIAVALTAATWLGGLWGPSAGLGEAAVPPPQPVAYFVRRTLSVLGNMTPLVLIPLLVIGMWHLALSVLRRKERFAEITLAWTLPLVGMFGFLLGAAYPYFRFFNATLTPILLAAVGIAVIIRMSRRVARGRTRGIARFLPTVVTVAVVGLLLVWWRGGLGLWNTSGSWLTPEVREEMAAIRAYLDATPGQRALLVIDAQPGAEVVPYGEYKEYVNSAFAGVEGDQIDDVVVFFGRVEDLAAGTSTTIGVEQSDAISAQTAPQALRALDRDQGNLTVFVPSVFNQYSTNLEAVRQCPGELCGRRLGDAGLYLLPDLSGTPVSPPAESAARAAAREARDFVTTPPGPGDDLGSTLLSLAGLALLFVVPGWLLFVRIPGLSAVEGLVLVPMLSIGAVTVIAVAAVGVLRGPITPTLGWATWVLAVAIGLAVNIPTMRDWVARALRLRT